MQNAEKLDLRQPRLGRGSGSCVLVVDDVPTNRSVLKSLLVKPDCEVFEAEDGEQALEIVESSQLDLVVLDVVMPGMNGIDVLGHIRERFSSSELPVLMLTVKDDIDEVVRALELGANVLTIRVNGIFRHYKQCLRVEV